MLFQRQLEQVKFFYLCYIKTKEYADEVIQHLRDNDCEVDVMVDLTEDFVEQWNSQYK